MGAIRTQSRLAWLLIAFIANIAVITTSCDGLFGPDSSSDRKPTESQGREVEIQALAPTLWIMDIVMPIAQGGSRALFIYGAEGWTFNDNHWGIPEPAGMEIQGEENNFTIIFDQYKPFSDDRWVDTELGGELHVTVSENTNLVVVINGTVNSRDFTVNGSVVENITFEEATISRRNRPMAFGDGTVWVEIDDDAKITVHFSEAVQIANALGLWSEVSLPVGWMIEYMQLMQTSVVLQLCKSWHHEEFPPKEIQADAEPDEPPPFTHVAITFSGYNGAIGGMEGTFDGTLSAGFDGFPDGGFDPDRDLSSDNLSDSATIHVSSNLTYFNDEFRFGFRNAEFLVDFSTGTAIWMGDDEGEPKAQFGLYGVMYNLEYLTSIVELMRAWAFGD
ncbi:MAG: hypothetical protein EA404_15045 [Spirochaetaceae bacterium]|nr:MAG: hypothetical protein EA404_15045 [Spirochaetaceae bacterium]